MFTILMLAAIAAACYGFVTTSPTLALMAWLGSGGLGFLAYGFKDHKLEWVRPVQLRKFFSARVFLATLAGLVIFLSVASGGDRQVAWQLGMFMVFATAMISLMAIISVAEGEWAPDPRPFKDRAWVSGRTWTSMAVAMLPTNIFVLLLK